MKKTPGNYYLATLFYSNQHELVEESFKKAIEKILIIYTLGQLWDIFYNKNDKVL